LARENGHGKAIEESSTLVERFPADSAARLKDALTTDRHFRQMGFHILP
jgi:hypothetical protein